MLYSVAGAKNQFRILLALFVGVIALGSSPAVYAQDSTVNLSVCGSGAGSTVTIDLPINDSVVDQPTVQVSGTVAGASQIDVSVDGQYDSTIPLGPGQGNYSTPVQLTSGTHTISLVANDVCNVQDGNASVVVTYQPQSNPGTGGATPTEVGDGGGAILNNDPIEPDDDKKTGLDSWPVIGPLIQFGRDMAIALDFEVTSRPGTLWQSMVRFSLIVVGISIALFGNVAVSAWGWTNGKLSIAKQWGIRALGIILMLVAFVI
jgi:hypothetical protein